MTDRDRPYHDPVHEYHSLFNGLVLLPAQAARSVTWTGVQRLFAALLQEAIQTAFTPRHIPGYSLDAMRRYGRRNLQKEAWAWIESDDESHCCTFRRTCFALSLDPAWLRRQIRAAQPASHPVQEST